MWTCRRRRGRCSRPWRRPNDAGGRLAPVRRGVQRRDPRGERGRGACAVVPRHAPRCAGEPDVRRRRDYGRGERRHGDAADVARAGPGPHGDVSPLRGAVPARGRRGPLEAPAARVRRYRGQEPRVQPRGRDDVRVDPAGAGEDGRRRLEGLRDPRALPVPATEDRGDGGGPADGPPHEGGAPPPLGQGRQRGGGGPGPRAPPGEAAARGAPERVREPEDDSETKVLEIVAALDKDGKGAPWDGILEAAKAKGVGREQLAEAHNRPLAKGP